VSIALVSFAERCAVVGVLVSILTVTAEPTLESLEERCTPRAE
jgi:hypothetical protein